MKIIYVARAHHLHEFILIFIIIINDGNKASELFIDRLFVVIISL